MKKIYLVLCAVIMALGSQAQVLPNAGFESWHINTAGGSTPKAIYVANSWYGADSLIISLGEAFGSILMIDDSVWKPQLFKDSLNVHSGTYSAKIVTKDQDTLGIFPGVVSNAAAHVNLTDFSLYYTGGTHITYRANTVSAWVKYIAGAAADSGVLTVQVLGAAGGKPDSVLGAGLVKIGASTAFGQVTANIVYTNVDAVPDTIRVTFASSKGGTASTINSTLYIDDVTMTGSPLSAAELAANGSAVSVYPNPATNTLHLGTRGNEAITCKLVSVTGQVVATKTFTGNTTMDVAQVAAGLYFYSIIDANGNTTQTGNVSIAK